jgi:hypothetical protein
MTLPEKLKAQYLARLAQLITEGTGIAASILEIPSKTSWGAPSVERDWDRRRLAKWRANCLTLLEPFGRQGTRLKEQLDFFAQVDGNKRDLESCVGILEALREDLEKGFLDELVLRVEAEVAANYMSQAEALLGEGVPGKFDHVPAAVLAGAVLEKALRTLCNQQQPPIVTTDAKGIPKTLNPLIDDLKKAAVFNELKAKQLRAWADVRNKAAHGEFDQFKKSDVEQMIQGINIFLADHLK